MLLEFSCGVDKALKLYDTTDPIEGSQLKLHRCQDVQCCEPSELVPVLRRELAPKPSLDWFSIPLWPTLARDEQEISRLHTIRVVRCWIARGRKLNAEFFQPFVDHGTCSAG